MGGEEDPLLGFGTPAGADDAWGWEPELLGIGGAKGRGGGAKKGGAKKGGARGRTPASTCGGGHSARVPASMPKPAKPKP